MNKINKHQHKRAADNGLKSCFVTKNFYPREEMIRFVISPEREVVFDVNEKLPGAGIWLYPLKESLDKAIEKRIFYKAAKGTVKIPDNLNNIVLNSLKSKGLNLISFARKSGCLVFGFESVKKAVEAQKILVAFEAEDAAKNGHDKLYRPTDTFPVYNCFSRQELGSVTGQDEQVHLGITDDKMARVLIQLIKKVNLLQGY